MINAIFDFCVWLLVVGANWLEISYQAINVWIFVILWPLFTLGLLTVIAMQARQIRRLRRLP